MYTGNERPYRRELLSIYEHFQLYIVKTILLCITSVCEYSESTYYTYQWNLVDTGYASVTRNLGFSRRVNYSS